MNKDLDRISESSWHGKEKGHLHTYLYVWRHINMYGDVI